MITLTTNWQLIKQTYLGTSGGNLYIRLYARYTEQNYSDNKTYVEYNSRVYYENSTYILDNQGTGYVEGTGASKVSFNATRPTTGETYSYTTGGWVYHANDGTGSASGTAYLKFPNWGWSGTASDTFLLPTIPRASQPSCITWPNTTQNIGNLGDEITIHMNRKSSNFVHSVKYSFGNRGGVIARNVTDNCQWTIPNGFALEIPNATSGSGTITVDTYNGDTYIGSKSANFTVTVPDTEEFRPKITGITLWENSSSDVPQDWAFYVQNKSKLSYDVVASGAYSSTIISYYVVVNGGYSNSKSDTTDFLLLSGINTIVATITDSRGRTATYSKTFEVLEYNGPTINNFVANRCLENGTLDNEGEFAKIEITTTIPSLNNKNGYSYYFQYRNTYEDEYTIYDVEMTESINETTITISANFIITADGNNSFDYMFAVADNFISRNKVYPIDTVFQLMNFNDSGRGMAIGKVSEKDALEISMDMYDKFGQLMSNGLAEYKDNEAIDPNTTSSHLILTETNTPNNEWFYVMTLFYSLKSVTARRTQIAIPYIYDINQNRRELFIRQNVDGEWNDWSQI